MTASIQDFTHFTETNRDKIGSAVLLILERAVLYLLVVVYKMKSWKQEFFVMAYFSYNSIQMQR